MCIPLSLYSLICKGINIIYVLFLFGMELYTFYLSENRYNLFKYDLYLKRKVQYFIFIAVEK